VTHRDLKDKRPDAAGTGPGHGHGGTNSMPTETLQAPEPIDARPDLDAVKRMRMEMGVTEIEFAGEHLEQARPELLEAMKCLDSTEHRDLHLRLGNFLNELDDFRSVLAERCQS
jgi:hypothetical protein